MFKDGQKNSDAWAAEFSRTIEAVSSQQLLGDFSIPTDKEESHRLLEEGKYLFSPQEIEINQPVLDEILESLIDAFRGVFPDKVEDLDNLDRAFHSGQLPSNRLLQGAVNNSLSELKDWSRNYLIDINILMVMVFVEM